MIYLLDLNYTLVENSHEKGSPFIQQIAGEQYRAWLVDRLRAETVILITARPERFKAATLRSIQSKTGWTPAEAYFNTINQPPPVIKEHVLKTFIFPRHGADPAQYFAIESNPKTRAMYARHFIRSCAAETFRTT